MKVSELITALQALDPDLTVYAYCDHGQTAEMVSAPSEIFVADMDHTLYDGFAYDEAEGMDYGYEKKAVLL